MIFSMPSDKKIDFHLFFQVEIDIRNDIYCTTQMII